MVCPLASELILRGPACTKGFYLETMTRVESPFFQGGNLRLPGGFHDEAPWMDRSSQSGMRRGERRSGSAESDKPQLNLKCGGGAWAAILIQCAQFCRSVEGPGDEQGPAGRYVATRAILWSCT